MQASRLFVTYAVVTTLLSVSVAGAQSTVRARIDAANKASTNAYNAGNVAKFVDVYAADAVLMPPNAPAMHGRAAIMAYWTGGWKNGVRNVELTTTEFSSHGDMAHEVGTYALDIQPAAGGAPMHDHGKYIVIWKRDHAGHWQWYRDIFNSDMPAGK